MVTASSSFVIKYNSQDNFLKNEEWIKLAIAHSRLFVDDDVKKGILLDSTKFCLANAFSVVYWLPMRKDSPTIISSVAEQTDNNYIVNTKRSRNTMCHSTQLSFFEDDNDA